MTNQEASSILSKNHFYGYFGPGYSTSKAIDSFMRLYPRRKGISTRDKETMELYDACLFFKQKQSRNHKSIKKHLHPNKS